MTETIFSSDCLSANVTGVLSPLISALTPFSKYFISISHDALEASSAAFSSFIFSVPRKRRQRRVFSPHEDGRPGDEVLLYARTELTCVVCLKGLEAPSARPSGNFAAA